MPFRRTLALDADPDFATLKDAGLILARAALYMTAYRRERWEQCGKSLHRLMAKYDELYEGFYTCACLHRGESANDVVNRNYVYHMTGSDLRGTPYLRFYIFRSVAAMKQAIRRELGEEVLGS